MFLGLLIALTAFSVQAAAPKRVLILHSFGRDFAPYDAIVSVFRTELAERSPDPVTFIEANLEFGRATGDNDGAAFVQYLRSRFDDAPPDVVVTIGVTAARYYLRHRGELFPAVPVVLGGLDARLVPADRLQAQDAAVAGRIELPRLIDNIVQLLPETNRIAVVIGSSDLERFWRSELAREVAPYANRIEFEWLDGKSLAQMQERAAALPPRSAILYGLFIVDGAGVPHERHDALAKLHAVANAPIFGLYESELGQGIVGGPYSSQRRNGHGIAMAALRALNGEARGGPLVEAVGFEPPVYDWRELERWRIEPSRLPPDSEIRFRPPSLWAEHRVAVVATATALALQALLIAALMLQRARRRRAELEAEALAGRLVTAHEDERRRLGRELHDDVTQRLAGLAIEAAELERSAGTTPGGVAAHAIREGLVELGEDVHALSYRLHPSVIEDLGLVEALQIECDRVAQQGGLRVRFDCEDVPASLPPDAALCLFRVAQEALRNVERHAEAKRVDVRVRREDAGIALAVRDDGVGFDASRADAKASLGLASMRERIRLQGGRLAIDSGRGGGTSLSAWVPLGEAA